MKRISMIGLVFAVALVIGGSSASSASALICVYDPGFGNYVDSLCLHEGTGEYTLILELGEKIGVNEYCGRVPAGHGDWNDSKCTVADGTREWLKFRLGWHINGTPLAAGATAALATTAHVDESTTLNSPSLGVKLTCSGETLSGKGAYIQGEASGGAESLTFSGCSELTPSTCRLEATTITSKALVASVELGTAPLDRIRFAPKSGKSFTSITFEGTLCPVEGTQPINGQVVLDSKTGADELVTQPLEPLGTTENNSLELAGGKVYLEKGKALLKLASGLPWSFY